MSLNLRLSFCSLPGKAPVHITASHANWNHDVEMEFQLMGDRAVRARDMEAIGFGALLDLSYDLWMKEQEKA
jgi:hypothetical protein